ncbi:glutamyl-tRNA(Gln) amidotransferase subunit A, mitochondrial isoform X2 [Prorops nasuta]|uniref:glutamyl-tRNA(Gln) amidotransferase subunit A, mitochondrial isoform X2 n=1 Tax=Prorops nasuta TaxID=863751 RepID=UPI0034CDCC29
MNKFLFDSIINISRDISTGKLIPSEICKAALDLTFTTKSLNAFITITDQLAKHQSVKADNRQVDNDNKGLLDGIPIAIKDNYCVKDELTSCGSLMLSNFISPYNSTVYDRLEMSGAILIGKTNLDEFAMGSGTVNSYYGPTKNIWNSEVFYKFYSINNSNVFYNKQNLKDDWYIAGGSSGGSAVAVASGACYGAIGSDTGGSTRNPASYCGLVGLKPSYGLISRYGLIPLVNSMDTPGILTRTVDDAIVILNHIAGADPADSTTLRAEYIPFFVNDDINLQNLVVGIPKEYNTVNLSEETLKCWMDVTNYLIEGGAKIMPVSLPNTKFSVVCYAILNCCEVASNMARYDGIQFGYRSFQGDTFSELYKNTRSEAFTNIVKERIFTDILLTPTTLTEAPRYKDFVKLDNQSQSLVQDYCTQPVNMAGLPAISIPICLSNNGLPLSLQLIAPMLHERRLCEVAKYIEKIVNFPKLELQSNAFCHNLN